MGETKQERGTTLYERINRVKADIERVKKSGFNSHFKYQYATESDISDMVRPLMAKHGVCLLFKGVDRDIHITPPEQGDKQFLYRIWMKYELVNADNPSERETLEIPSEALDHQDKGITKAMTAGAKYAWLKIFDISTGDEADDADSHGSAEAASGRAPSVAPPVLGAGGVTSMQAHLEQRGLTPDGLVAAMKVNKLIPPVVGWESKPEQWPQSMIPDIKTLIEKITLKEPAAAPVVPKPATKPKDPLLAAVEAQWKVWYPGRAGPNVGNPQNPAALIAAMRRTTDWHEIPEGPERDKQMISDLKDDRVLPDGTKIPF